MRGNQWNQCEDNILAKPSQKLKSHLLKTTMTKIVVSKPENWNPIYWSINFNLLDLPISFLFYKKIKAIYCFLLFYSSTVYVDILENRWRVQMSSFYLKKSLADEKAFFSDNWRYLKMISFISYSYSILSFRIRIQFFHFVFTVGPSKKSTIDWSTNQGNH